MATFADILLMFKTFHLSVSKFGFLLFCHFRTENHNRMSILPQNYAWFWKQCSYGVRDKIGIVKDFLYVKGKVREKQSLIHLNESFWTLREYLQKPRKFRGISEVYIYFPIFFHLYLVFEWMLMLRILFSIYLFLLYILEFP